MAGTFFADLGNTITSQANGMADTVAANLASAIVPLFVSAGALMIFFHGLSVIRGDSQQPFMGLLWKIFKLGMIIAVIASYQGFGVVDVVLSIQSGLVQAIAGANNAFQVIDQTYGPLIGFFAGLVIFGMSMFTDGSMGTITIGLLVFFFIIMGGAVLALALFYALLSTLGLLIVLGLGPLFIAGLAFGPTARYFDGWLSSVLSFSLLGAVSSVVLTFVSKTEISVVGQAFPNIISGAIEVTIVSFVFLLFMLEVPRLVGHLTSGADATGGVVGFAQMRGVYGAPWFGKRAAGNAASKAAKFQSLPGK